MTPLDFHDLLATADPDRRALLLGLAGVLMLAPARAVADVATFAATAREAQIAGAKGTTVGTLTGTGLKEAVYVQATIGAPAALVSAFVSAVQSRAAAFFTGAADTYVDYTVTKSSGDIGQAGALMRSHIGVDLGSFGGLDSVMTSAGSTVEGSKPSSMSEIRKLRDEIAALKSQVQLVKIERDRAENSDSIYQVSRRSVKRSRLDDGVQLDSRIAEVTAAARQLSQSAKRLETALIRF